MIFTRPVRSCHVRAFAALVKDADSDADRQLTVLGLTVEPADDQETVLVVPVPAPPDADLPCFPLVYGGILDDLRLCFSEELSEGMVEGARAHRTEAEPSLRKYAPRSLQDRLAPYNDENHWFLCVPIRGATPFHPIAYTHTARADKRLFVPGRSGGNESEVEYDHVVYTLNTTPDAGSMPFTRRLQTAFRWDLIRSLRFPPIETLHMFVQEGRHPDSDMYFCTRDTPEQDRFYMGGDGAIFRDKTRLRIVQYEARGLRTFPLVNGAFLTSPDCCDPFHFGGSECHFEEAPLPGAEDTWAVKITDEVGTDTPCVLWVKPWQVRKEVGRWLLEMHALEAES